MPVNDLASGTVYGPLVQEQLLAGDMAIKTSNGIASGAKTKYQIAALTSAGVVAFVAGTNTAAQAVLVMQPCADASPCQYAFAGIFNDALLATYNVALYADAALNTFAERQAFFNGLFRVGQVGGGWAEVV